MSAPREHGLSPYELAILRACSLGEGGDALPFAAANAAIEKLITSSILLPDGRLTVLGKLIVEAEK